MSEDRPNDLLSALPRTRPHRRSEKRGARPGAETAATGPHSAASTGKQAGAATRRAPATGRKTRGRTAAGASKPLRQPAQPRGIPKTRRAPERKPAPTTGAEMVGTAFQAVGELAGLGLALTARALRNAASRFPRP